MKLLLLTIACIFSYVLMVWFTTKRVEVKVQSLKWVLQATLGTICALWPVLFISKFWVLFVAALLLVVATYMGAQGGLFAKLSKNGMFGGLWLTIPLYVYLLPNT